MFLSLKFSTNLLNFIVMDKLQEIHNKYINMAIKDAKAAAANGNFPQACCLVHNDKLICRSADRQYSSGRRFTRAELIILNECPDYINDFGMECSFYSVFEPHYSVLPLLVDSGLKSFYFSIYQPEDSPADFIDYVEFFRKKIHHYSSGFHQSELIKLYNQFVNNH